MKNRPTSLQLIDQLIDWPIDWLTNWLVYWPIDWLNNLCIDWLIDWLIFYLFIYWLIYWWIDWLIDWLINWLIDFLTDWLTNWVIGFPYSNHFYFLFAVYICCRTCWYECQRFFHHFSGTYGFRITSQRLNIILLTKEGFGQMNFGLIILYALAYLGLNSTEANINEYLLITKKNQ